MLKKILRKGLKIIYWTLFVLLLILFFIGKRNLLGNLVILVQSIHLIYYIVNKIKYNNLFNAYFNGTEEEVEKYSKLVDEGANTIFKYSKLLLKDKYASKRQIKTVESIIQKTKRLKENIQPPV